MPCTDPTSPLKQASYVLQLDPRLKDLDKLCQIQTREAQACWRRRVERSGGQTRP